MCIRDREIFSAFRQRGFKTGAYFSKPDWHSDDYWAHEWACLLYTSDAADERSSVDLGGRRIIKKKNSLDIN